MQYDIKVIPGFEDYTIDTNGIVTEIATGKQLVTRLLVGYPTFQLYNNGYRCILTQHRAMMITFKPIANPDELQINHINGIKTDNSLDNLEWCTHLENLYHAAYAGLTPKCIPVNVLNVSDNIVYDFPSCELASKHIGISSDRTAYMLRFPNDVIHKGGWRIKKHTDTWKQVDVVDTALYKDLNKQPVCAFNWLSGKHVIYPSQREASLGTGISEALISLELTNGTQRILIGMWSFKRPDDHWIPVNDIWLKYELDNQSRPVVCTYPDGSRIIYESTYHCSRAIGVGDTTIYYRLKNGKTKPGRNGYAFEYYSDTVRLSGN